MEGKPKSSIYYTIYQYRQELARPEKNYKSLYKIKVTLTDELVAKSVENIKKCAKEDLRAITQGLIYKKKLVLKLCATRKSTQLDRIKATRQGSNNRQKV